MENKYIRGDEVYMIRSGGDVGHCWHVRGPLSVLTIEKPTKEGLPVYALGTLGEKPAYVAKEDILFPDFESARTMLYKAREQYPNPGETEVVKKPAKKTTKPTKKRKKK